MNVYVKGTEKSKWCNPFPVKKYGLKKCLEKYENYILSNEELMNDIPELYGKILGCWCREVEMENIESEICHGDILVKIIKNKIL